MAETFIERHFELGSTDEVTARFFRPVKRELDFCCDYEIAWPDKTRRFHAYGIDEVQALTLALRMAHANLLSSPEAKRGEIRWLGSKACRLLKDSGFPLV
ncbi:hypothetical protein FJV77_00010 [Mesorhizobium sp. WSM4306]|uniref:DUF6968 family protein n=1 Tax=Mesorhizobium sp. WSM4306 TaxID=2589885 RepID=UPI00115E99D4|nr:hypothetical protein [Mesorhizobium sp. WSM4306]TRD00277.1 hypothetical protein FJV77_00010 [Mesorhizobium sp. WSM4306]